MYIFLNLLNIFKNFILYILSYFLKFLILLFNKKH